MYINVIMVNNVNNKPLSIYMQYFILELLNI